MASSRGRDEMIASLYVLPIKTAGKEVVSLRGKARGKMWQHLWKQA